MTISLAFLAPDLVKAAVEGRLLRGIGVERLRDAPAEWSRQFETLGLNPTSATLFGEQRLILFARAPLQLDLPSHLTLLGVTHRN